MEIQKKVTHWNREAQADEWFKRTVELPSVPELLDQVAHLSADNERLFADKRLANVLAGGLAVMFLFFILWAVHNI